MVAANRGVAALPAWLAAQYCEKLAISTVRLGKHGIAKQIYLGIRDEDQAIAYFKSFIESAKQVQMNTTA